MSTARKLLWTAVATVGITVAAYAVSSCDRPGPFPGSAYGGGKVIVLEQGQKLVNVTWKMDTVWYTVRPMRPGELPERYEFHEDTIVGRYHGEVVIQEKAKAFP